jgi:membrane protein implicated in regulation of membrane protease activity
MELLNSLQWWHWLVLAMLLLLIEMLAPMYFFLWFSLAAGVMTLIVLIASNISWEAQLITFGILSVACLFAGRAWIKRRPIATDIPQLNRRGEQYIGRTFTLTEPIENGYGTVQVDDTRWRVHGPAAPAGHTVRVTGIDGTTLQVEAVS